MSLAAIVGIVLLMTLIDLSNGNQTTDQSETNSGNGQLAVSPLSWRCEIHILNENGSRLESCEEWAMDEEEFHVFHGGACKVARDDPDTKLPIIESLSCDKGQWSATGTSIDFPHSRDKRWGWVVFAVAVVIVAAVVVCLLICGQCGSLSASLVYFSYTYNSNQLYAPVTTDRGGGGGGGGGGGDDGVVVLPPIEPKFTKCPPDGISDIYFTPPGETSTIVTWGMPEAVDDDGHIVSYNQTVGGSNGSLFEGLISTGGLKHEILYEAKDNDGQLATCHFTFTVKVRTCDSLVRPSNGNVNCSNRHILGSTCTYNCSEGYELSDKDPVTCQGEENSTWSTIPACVKISCGSPPNVTNGAVACSDDGYYYNDICWFSCEDGFKLKGQVSTRCAADRKWFWEDPTSCTDDIPPQLSCDKHQIFYVERGTLSLAVNWMPPTASDNIDPNPTITQTSGPDQGVVIEAGSSKTKTVSYTASDTMGNKSPECTIKLEVKAVQCRHPMDVFDDLHIMFSCSMSTYTYGDLCNVSCMLNLPLEGSDLITCEMNITASGEPSGYWDWGNGSSPFCKAMDCPNIDPPTNGALAESFINSKRTFIMFCKNKYDIPDLGSSFNGIFLCQNDGTWIPNYTPGCSKTISNRGYRLPSQFYYYDGVCNESDTSNIMAAFDEIVAHLNETFKALCPDQTTCYVENPQVTCGSINRTKRHAPVRGSPDAFDEVKYKVRETSMHRNNLAEAHQVHKRQTVGDILRLDFNIITDFSSNGMADEDAFAFVDEIQLVLKEAIQSNLLNDEYSVPDWMYRDNSFQTADFGLPYCDPGSIPVRITKCSMCPPGHKETDGVCSVCPVGEYAEQLGSVKCTTCPDGFSTRRFASESFNNCTELCRPGSYSPDTFVPCAPCKAGYYQPLTGQTSCIACPTAMSTKAAGSTSEANCQYFDAYLYAAKPHVPEAIVIEAGIPSLDDFTLTLFTKTVSGYPDMPVIINVDDELRVIISDNIRVNTSSTDNVLGPSSQKDWVHVAVSWDSTAGLLTASYRGDLVVSHSSLQLSTVHNDSLSITAGDAGVLISGFRLQDTVIGQTSVDTSSSSCQVVDDTDVLSMDIFKDKRAEGVGVVVPTVCDGFDECLSSPCGSHGNCTNDIGGFTCKCFGKWTGDTCDIPPDFCKYNECSNGATCVSGIRNYTCECPLGNTGVLCETPPVDGGWSEWSTWADCQVTCNTGTRSRSRACNSPPPDEYGVDCQDEDIETEECNTSPCRECPELERGFKSILDCHTDLTTGTQVCIPKCLDGYARPPELTIDTYSCGTNTGYEWVPMKKVPGCVLPGRSQRYTISTTGTLNETVELEEEKNVKDAIQLNANNTDCYKSELCEVSVNISNDYLRRKRSTGATVTVSFSIPITDTSDLNLWDYMENGTVSPGLQEIIDAINNLEATAAAINESASSLFDVTVNGITYSVDADTVTFSGSTRCSDGQVALNGLCVACPAGSYQNSDYCSFCDKGTYQDQDGHSSCLECPTGYSTETIGSDNITDCLVTSGKPESNDRDGKKFIAIGVAVGVVMVVLTGVLIAISCVKKHMSYRAKVGDSRADMGDNKGMCDSKANMQVIANPIYANPSEMASAQVGPLNTRFSRETSSLSVRDLNLDISQFNDGEMELYK